MKGVFPPLNLGLFNANISFAFQAIQKLSVHLTNLCFAVICKFLVDFWGCLGRDSFSQRISKIWRNKNYSGNIEDLICF